MWASARLERSQAETAVDNEHAAAIGALPEWDPISLLDAVSAIVTCFGSIGVEATCLGKPVLVADHGWYSHLGFVRTAPSANSFLALLADEWWKQMDMTAARERALVVSALFWGVPEWQGNFILQDDSLQDALFSRIPEIVLENRGAAEREIEELRNWYQSDQVNIHHYKMLNADDFRIPGYVQYATKKTPSLANQNA